MNMGDDICCIDRKVHGPFCSPYRRAFEIVGHEFRHINNENDRPRADRKVKNHNFCQDYETTSSTRNSTTTRNDYKKLINPIGMTKNSFVTTSSDLTF